MAGQKYHIHALVWVGMSSCVVERGAWTAAESVSTIPTLRTTRKRGSADFIVNGRHSGVLVVVSRRQDTERERESSKNLEVVKGPLTNV